MKKDGKIIAIVVIVTLIVVLALLSCIIFLQKIKKDDSKENKVSTLNETNTVKNEVETPTGSDSEDIEIIPTMEDEVVGDTAWCPTFQLVWNDMKNELVEQDVEFIDGDEPGYLENLNDELFTEEDISDEYYYKKWGVKSNKLKEEILKGVKDKFDEDSDVIDESDDWGDGKDKSAHVFYAMLKKVFEYENPFDILDEGVFEHEGKWFENVKYFGIAESTKEEVKDQVTILYYEDNDNFAFSVATKDGDEVIFAKGVKGKTFAKIYEEIEKSADEYTGSEKMEEKDTLKIPNLKFNMLKEYKELEKKEIACKNGDEIIIEKALQTIKLEMDNKGGKIKSEAIIMTKETAMEEEEPPKKMNLDGEFVVFVKEEDKDLPYFALKVSDISKFQEGIEKLLIEE